MKKQTLSVPVQVRFSPDQIKAVRAAAKIARVPYTTFIREAAEARVHVLHDDVIRVQTRVLRDGSVLVRKIPQGEND